MKYSILKLSLIVLLSLLIIGCCIHFGLIKDCHDLKDCQKYPKPIQTF